MLVSFCVIAYNEEKALPSLFQDIISQDYPHEKMEVVLVDAMSTDNTRKLMEGFAQGKHGFVRVKVLENPKKIQAAGWNVAIRASEGDIIMRIDSHTFIPSDFVSKNVKCIESGEYVSGGPRPNIAEDDTVNNPVSVSLLSGDRKPQIRFWGNHHSGSGNLYHKSFRM